MPLNIQGFPYDFCASICSSPDECISHIPKHVKCITNIVVNRMCYVLSILSLLLQDNKYKEHEQLFLSAVNELQITSDWVKKIQGNGNDAQNDHVYLLEEDRRLCPRFKTDGITAEINGWEYPVSNLSLNGCFIKTGVPYPLSTNITMKLPIEGGISIAAMVKYSITQGIGVKFVNIEKAKENDFYSFMSDFFLKTARQNHDTI